MVSSRSRLVPNEILLVAAQTPADQISEWDRAEGRIYPPLSEIREVSLAIGTVVAEIAYDHGLAERQNQMIYGRASRRKCMNQNTGTTCILEDNRCA